MWVTQEAAATRVCSFFTFRLVIGLLIRFDVSWKSGVTASAFDGGVDCESGKFLVIELDRAFRGTLRLREFRGYIFAKSRNL